MQNSGEKLEIGKEYPAPDEAEAIANMTAIIAAGLKTDQDPVPRGQHAKHHGCVRAEFIVEENLPENLKFGVFKEAKTFPAWIRFSNASGDASQPDTKADGRGMTIKLMGVEGEKLLDDEKYTQDLLAINHPLFFIRDIPEYMDLFNAVKEAKGGPPLKFFFPSFNPFKWRFSAFRIIRAIQNGKINNPLFTQYWSTTPYKLGDGAMKYSAKPTALPAETKNPSKSENYLREAMVDYLKTNEAYFDFLVQLQTDAVGMPIEDPTIEWRSPFIKVATIKIPSQTFDSDEQMEFCEHLSYNPWHSLEAHRPLGGVNRARKLVYKTISERRHQLNHVSPPEPNGQESFPSH
ncbi:MAG: catalase family protein [Mastigocoleus sp. MO_167.B18]|uniref:catalase family protein n=1 Tax=Mastigocoleus sp. MO_188.B34 TaxID=3036635 RepID=UPI00260D7616|nr:catalase family protein [Mastigocoleus sp. MO_188.B34]MDJ0697697.1 catalase family protein [Mastigocoleus sp. MO_188.B34]MDJ0775949.1 catalase family protein [Mastigocoleus sp. MO_167.B18]